MMKIAIMGTGGVGGYVGAFLAKKYENSAEVEIFFIARGENERVINRQGIRLESTRGSFIAFPKKTVSNTAEIGIVDLLICCTKNYDIEQSIQQYRSCIGPETVILPLLNGVTGTDIIKAILPGNEVWYGCIYIVSHLEEPGFVQETGKVVKIYLGSSGENQKKSQEAARIFQEANLQAIVPPDILVIIWEKFICISTFATITSYLDCHIGDILANAEHKLLLYSLLNEIIAIAGAKKMIFDGDIFQRTMEIFINFPYDATSSMHLDFKKGKKTELEFLTGHVVRMGESLNVPVPVYDRIYSALK